MLVAGIFGAQRSNDDREGVVGGSDRKSRESDPGDLRQGGFARRKALLAELAALETRRRADSAVDDVRRRRLLAELEHIYGELDEAHAPRGGGEDVAT